MIVVEAGDETIDINAYTSTFQEATALQRMFGLCDLSPQARLTTFQAISKAMTLYLCRQGSSWRVCFSTNLAFGMIGT